MLGRVRVSMVLKIDKGSPACFAHVLAIVFEQDVCVSVRVCLGALPSKRPTHPYRIADVAPQVVTSRLAGAKCITHASCLALCKRAAASAPFKCVRWLLSLCSCLFMLFRLNGCTVVLVQSIVELYCYKVFARISSAVVVYLFTYVNK